MLRIREGNCVYRKRGKTELSQSSELDDNEVGLSDKLVLGELKDEEDRLCVKCGSGHRKYLQEKKRIDSWEVRELMS